MGGLFSIYFFANKVNIIPCIGFELLYFHKKNVFSGMAFCMLTWIYLLFIENNEENIKIKLID